MGHSYNINEAITQSEQQAAEVSNAVLICAGSLYLAGSVIKHCGGRWCIDRERRCRKDGQMINFEEELKKFKPNLEIDQAEEAIYKNDLGM